MVVLALVLQLCTIQVIVLSLCQLSEYSRYYEEIGTTVMNSSLPCQCDRTIIAYHLRVVCRRAVRVDQVQQYDVCAMKSQGQHQRLLLSIGMLPRRHSSIVQILEKKENQIHLQQAVKTTVNRAKVLWHHGPRRPATPRR